MNGNFSSSASSSASPLNLSRTKSIPEISSSPNPFNNIFESNPIRKKNIPSSPLEEDASYPILKNMAASAELPPEPEPRSMEGESRQVAENQGVLGTEKMRKAAQNANPNQEYRLCCEAAPNFPSTVKITENHGKKPPVENFPSNFRENSETLPQKLWKSTYQNIFFQSLTFISTLLFNLLSLAALLTAAFLQNKGWLRAKVYQNSSPPFTGDDHVSVGLSRVGYRALDGVTLLSFQISTVDSTLEDIGFVNALFLI
eukprot:Sdes_comp19274_c0_seq1m10280